MRISTDQLFREGSQAISRQQSEWFRTQNQLSAGKRLLSAADDPIAAAQALRVEQARAQTMQYTSNQGAAKSTLTLAESSLGQAGDLLSEARTVIINAKDGVLSDADRRSLALELRSKFDQILGIANTRDADGEYLFSGYAGGTQPFAASTAGASYQGDEGERRLQVSSSRTLAVSASGAQIFERVPDGNGRFRIAGATNAGSLEHNGGSVTDPSALTGHDYRIVFHVAGPATTYDVLDQTLGTSLVTGAAWTAGQAISFDGMQVGLQGIAADGDRFDVRPSASRNLFDTLKGLISALETPLAGAASRAAFANLTTTGLLELDQAIDRVVETRATFGARLQELDSLDAQVSAQRLQFDQTLSTLTDLDYAEAASRFSAQQTALEAAQRSYLRVTSLSLFDYF